MARLRVRRIRREAEWSRFRLAPLIARSGSATGFDPRNPDSKVKPGAHDDRRNLQSGVLHLHSTVPDSIHAGSVWHQRQAPLSARTSCTVQVTDSRYSSFTHARTKGACSLADETGRDKINCRTDSPKPTHLALARRLLFCGGGPVAPLRYSARGNNATWHGREFRAKALESWIDRFAFQGQHAEYALMDPCERLGFYESVQAFEAELHLSSCLGSLPA